VTDLADAALRTVAALDGDTPAYVYDLAVLRAAHDLLTGALPTPSGLLYSLKANPHPALLAELRALGCGAEVSSLGEAVAALEAGFPPELVLYTGPAKRDADVVAALDRGVRWFSADAPAGLAQLERLAAWQGCEVRCLLRVNGDVATPGQGLTMTGVPSQFGADVAWIEREPERFAGSPRVAVEGLHTYLGSNIASEDDVLAQFLAALAAVERLGPVFGGLATVNLGGGFGAPYARAGELPRFPTLAARLEPHLDRVLPGWRQGAPRVLFESGRYLTSTCGQLVVRVLDVKRSHGTSFVVLDSGINHLGGMSGLRRLPVVVPTPLAHVDGERGGSLRATLAGPLCTPLDVWGRNVELPPLRPGDLVTIPNVGAYGLYASLVAFLGHPLPVELVVDGDEVTSRTRLVIGRQPVSTAEE
jgi:diaminopimelate decarboxylase